MAVEVPISGGPEQAKIRNEWGVAGLTIITLGIYSLVWWYKINREMADLGRKNGTTELGTNPTLSVLAIFPGVLLIVPAVWTIITTFGRAQKAQVLTGVDRSNKLNGGIYALFWVISFFVPLVNLGAYIYMQSGLNKAWQSHTGYQSSAIVPGAAAATPVAAPPGPPAPPVPPAAPAAPEPKLAQPTTPPAPPAPPAPPTPPTV